MSGNPLPPPTDDERMAEAILFAATEPLSREHIARYMHEGSDVSAALDLLARRYAGRGVELVKRGGRWQFQTAADLKHIIRPEHENMRPLSRAATETLAIIAYHEPVSRAEIEAIRGVQTSKGTLDVLMESGWVRPAGRRESPGRPLIYATTPEFLSHFGLTSRKELPDLEDLRAAGLLGPVELDNLPFGGDETEDDRPANPLRQDAEDDEAPDDEQLPG